MNRCSTNKYDSFFAFSLPNGQYFEPYYKSAGKPWTHFSPHNLFTTVRCKGDKHTKQNEMVQNVHYCERMGPLVAPELLNEKTYVFMFYKPDLRDPAKPTLEVNPQPVDYFHAYPYQTGTGAPSFKMDHEKQCLLHSYGLYSADFGTTPFQEL